MDKEIMDLIWLKAINNTQFYTISASAAMCASEQNSKLLSNAAVLLVKLVESAAVISNTTFTFGC